MRRRIQRLKSVIENTDTKAGRLFDLFIQTLIVLSLVSFSIETLPELSQQAQMFLKGFEIFSVAIFTVEYVLRVIVADNKIRSVTSFFGIVDLIAILPFYLSIGIDLRSVRALRLLRLFRVLKLARYSKAMQRFHCAILIAKEEIIIFLCTTVILLFLSAVGIYYFENEAQPEVFSSVFHSLWWSIVTLTTVGYGDVYPITLGGRIFTSLILLVGLGIVSVPAGLVASALTKAREIESTGSANPEPPDGPL